LVESLRYCEVHAIQKKGRIETQCLMRGEGRSEGRFLKVQKTAETMSDCKGPVGLSNVCKFSYNLLQRVSW